MLNQWRGEGNTTGAVIALILLTFGLTGGVALLRLLHTNNILTQATTIALQSEEQNGCWTAATTQAVTNTLKAGGLTPSATQVTQYTATTQSYGQPIHVGLRYPLQISVVTMPVMTIPIQSAESGSSFYVPNVSGGTNAGCTSPTLGNCPQTTYQTQCTPAHQSCQPETIQQCTPVTTLVCGTTYQSRCGYIPISEYTCGYQPSCGWTIRNVCSTTEQYELLWCLGTPSDPYKYCHYGWGPHTTCTPQSVYSCQQIYSCGWRTTDSYTCSRVPVRTCSDQTTQSCYNVTTTHCTTIPQSCQQVPVTINTCG